MQTRPRVYGPVPSRRLGLSLGVDLVPFKACPYDCVYCQLGPTRCLTCDRETYWPVTDLAEEVRWALRRGPAPDVITLAGSGEPTLYHPLGDLIVALKEFAPVPVALLTNGALFWDPAVRAAAALADLVLPSLDAGDERRFRLVNRPHGDLTLERVVAGLETFRSEYPGRIWLEITVVAGLTDDVPSMRRTARQARRIRPDRVHLNTPVRPSPLDPSAAVSVARLESLCALFDPIGTVVAAPEPQKASGGADGEPLQERLVGLLSRRPCTLEDISLGLGVAPNEVVKVLASLEAAGRVSREPRGRDLFYVSPAGEGGR